MTHDTAMAIGALTAPDQDTTAKLAAATTNAIAFGHLRLQIATVGTLYAAISRVDFSDTEFMAPNTAAPMLAGPYTFTFLTQVTCTTNCSPPHENSIFVDCWMSSGNPASRHLDVCCDPAEAQFGPSRPNWPRRAALGRLDQLPRTRARAPLQIRRTFGSASCSSSRAYGSVSTTQTRAYRGARPASSTIAASSPDRPQSR
jgi:hypothetical protein